MLDAGEYCFWCMNRLPSRNGVCKACGKDNRERRNAPGELPFSLLSGKYLVGHALGRGGFGITYIGMNVFLGKRVAIKEYFPADASVRAEDGINVRPLSEEANKVFEAGKWKTLEEARIIARVQNVSNVVNIYDCFGLNNTVYIIMEFIEGETFAAYAAKKGPLRWQELWTRIRPVGVALGRLHRLNLIHRDISPDNIMIRRDNDESILLDFGAASGAVPEGQESMTAMKDGYAPVEQYRRGAEINGRADQYAWSATIWYMLTGVKPPSAIQREAQHIDPKLPGKLKHRVPESVRRALLRGMAVRQEDRFASIEELITALDVQEGGAGAGKAVLIIAAVLAFLVMAVSLAAGFLK